MVDILGSITLLATTAGTVNATLKSIIGVGGADIISNTLGNLVSDGIKNAVSCSLSPQDKQKINHDLQQAFRDAIYEALYDIGGPACFPAAWKPPRDVPAEVIYWRQGNYSPQDGNPPLAADPSASAEQQRCACLWRIGRMVKDEQLFPLEPPLDDDPPRCQCLLLPATPHQPGRTARHKRTLRYRYPPCGL